MSHERHDSQHKHKLTQILHNKNVLIVIDNADVYVETDEQTADFYRTIRDLVDNLSSIKFLISTIHVLAPEFYCDVSGGSNAVEGEKISIDLFNCEIEPLGLADTVDLFFKTAENNSHLNWKSVAELLEQDETIAPKLDELKQDYLHLSKNAEGKSQACYDQIYEHEEMQVELKELLKANEQSHSNDLFKLLDGIPQVIKLIALMCHDHSDNLISLKRHLDRSNIQSIRSTDGDGEESRLAWHKQL